jgi:hypothetical protein
MHGQPSVRAPKFAVTKPRSASASRIEKGVNAAQAGFGALSMRPRSLSRSLMHSSLSPNTAHPRRAADVSFLGLYPYASAACGSQATTSPQPLGFTTRFVDAGWRCSFSAERRGRRCSSPPQFGQRPFNTPCEHRLQKVHSNEQMYAAPESPGRSLPQHSQFGRSSNISISFQRSQCGAKPEDAPPAEDGRGICSPCSRRL